MVSLGLTSTEFLLLLPMVALIYYIVPIKMKKHYLLLINLLFYASFGPKYLLVIIGEALVVWLVSLKEKRTIGLIVGCILLTSVLILFRSSAFTQYTIVAPLGISFYTLQAISYLIDVKRKKIEAEKNFFKIFTYLSFFPTITSGPIIRYAEFRREHDRNSTDLRADYYQITNGIIYMLYGYFLKLVVAERAAIPVNNLYSEIGFENMGYSGTILFIIAVTYSVQIYADFAGYSAIVIGIAQIFGYRIAENFCSPYLSANLKEFWTRWHISLSSWLRDYIYIPLGGNRRGRGRKYANLMLTFIISGLWHGFKGHFLVWGVSHGVGQVLLDATSNFRKKFLQYVGGGKNSFCHKLMQRIITFLYVTFAWIFFRTGVKDAVKYIFIMLTSMDLSSLIDGELWSLGLSMFGWILLGGTCLIMVVVDIIRYKKNIRIDEVINNRGPLVKGISVILMVLVTLIFGIYGDQHDASYFLYRDF